MRLILAAGVVVAVALYALVAVDANQHWEPHRFCLLNTSWLVWLNAGFDLGIFAAYFCIPAGLIALALSLRGLLPITVMLVAFGAFIVSCGLGHLIDAGSEWFGLYYAKTAVDGVTLVASAITAIYFLRVIFQLLGAMRRQPELRERIKAFSANVMATASGDILAAIADAAERKRREEHLRLVVEGAPNEKAPPFHYALGAAVVSRMAVE